MAIFSRTKRANKGIKEITDVTTTERVYSSPPPPSPPPSRPVPVPPVDPTKHEVVLSAEEVRARIAANRKRQSDIIRRSAALSYSQSRTVSEYSEPGSGWQTHRLKEPTTIETILQNMPLHDTTLVPSPLAMRGRQPVRGENELVRSRPHSQDEIDSSWTNPRAVPLPPPVKTHPSPPPRSRSRRLTKSKTNPSIPLPTASIQLEEDYFSSSSRDSARNSASTTNSVTSSATSTSSIPDQRVETKRTSVKIPNFSKPNLPMRREKKVEVLDISLPYSSTVAGVEQEVKTAKSLIPTWRYEDLRNDNVLPLAVTTIPPTHTRNFSWAHTQKSSFGGARFRKKNLSSSAF